MKARENEKGRREGEKRGKFTSGARDTKNKWFVKLANSYRSVYGKTIFWAQRIFYYPKCIKLSLGRICAEPRGSCIDANLVLYIYIYILYIAGKNVCALDTPWEKKRMYTVYTNIRAESEKVLWPNTRWGGYMPLRKFPRNPSWSRTNDFV